MVVVLPWADPSQRALLQLLKLVCTDMVTWWHIKCLFQTLSPNLRKQCAIVYISEKRLHEFSEIFAMFFLGLCSYAQGLLRLLRTLVVEKQTKEVFFQLKTFLNNTL